MNGQIGDPPQILPCGDSAFTIEFGQVINPFINQKVHVLCEKIRSKPLPGLIDLIPSYRSLLIQYNPVLCSFEELKAFVREVINAPGETASREMRLVEIPVCYGGDFGPDLEEVAALQGLSPETVIQLHSDPVYQVYMIGFTPGFPFLGGLNSRLFTPRKKTPRQRVPAGTVGIADQQTGIYSLDSPGGWQLIGRTPVKLFDLDRDDPFYLKPGDRVRFYPIRPDEFTRLSFRSENQKGIGSN
jgi:inhibitor of KinA